MDAEGRALATGRTPRPPGWGTPALAVGAAPVVTWPLAAVDGAGGRVGLAAALGPGGGRVERLLAAVAAPPAPDVAETVVAALAPATPAGPVALPVEVVGLRAAVESEPDGDWLAEVGRARDAARDALCRAGRGDELEAAVHLAVLLGAERFDPADDADEDAHAASGAQLWLLTGAVASALGGTEPDPFAAWARLVVAGWWPVGPCRGHLVVCRPA